MAVRETYELDTKPAEKALDEFEKEVKDSAKRQTESIAKEGRKSGEEMAKELVAGFRKERSTRKAQLKEQFVSGMIDKGELRRAGKAIDREINQKALKAMKKLERQGKLTTESQAKLSQSLRTTAVRSRQAGDAGSKAGRDMSGAWSKAKFAVGAVVAVIAGSRVVSALKDWVGQAVEVQKSFMTLSASAKLFGVEQEQLVDLSRQAREEYKLTIRQSNELATVTTKLAARAGDAAQAELLLARALDLGAAQGLDAQEVSVALDQSLRGLDEGTDKLLQKNPSQIYEEWAEQAGIAAGTMTDAQQKQALVNAVLTQGTKVQGSYGDMLDSNVGKLTMWNRIIQASRERIGGALIPILAEWAETGGLIETATDGIVRVLEDIQIAGSAAAVWIQKLKIGLMELRESAKDVPIIGGLFGDHDFASLGRAREELRRLEEAHLQFVNDLGGRSGGASAPAGSPAASGGGVSTAGPGTVAAAQAVGPALPVLEEFRGLLKEIPVESMEFLGFLQTVSAAVQEATAAQEELNVALLEGDPGRIAAAEERLAAAKENLRDRTKEVIPLLESAGLSQEKMAEIIAELTENLEDLNVELEETGEGWEEFAETMEGVARGVLSVLDAAGALDDELRRALQGVIDIASAVQDIDFSNFFSTGNIGGITQMVGGAIGILNSLFGESPEDRRRQEELQKNTDALIELRNDLGALRDALGGSSGRFIQAARRIVAEGAERAPLGFGVNVRFVREELAKLGFSFEQLKQLARDLGIGALDTTEGWKDLNEALQEIELDRFFEGFRGQLDLLQREMDLFDVDDPVQELERLFDLFLQFTDVTSPVFEEGPIPELSTLFGSAFEDIDLSTQEGREQLDALIKELFEQFRAGELDLSQFGDLTAEEFLDLLSRMESAIDEAGGTDGGRGTTRSVQIARSITEVQAVEVVAWLEEIAFWVKETTLTLRAMSGIQATTSALADMSSSPSRSVGQASSGGAALINNGTIMVDPSLTEQQFDQIWTDIGRRIWLESQGASL